MNDPSLVRSRKASVIFYFRCEAYGKIQSQLMLKIFSNRLWRSPPYSGALELCSADYRELLKFCGEINDMYDPDLLVLNLLQVPKALRPNKELFDGHSGNVTT